MSCFIFIQTNALLKLVCLYFVQNPWRGILKMIANNNTNSKSTYKIVITLISETFLREIIHKQLLTMRFLIQSSYLVTR